MRNAFCSVLIPLIACLSESAWLPHQRAQNARRGPRLAGFAFDGSNQSAQPNRSRPFRPGECGPVDPTYIQTANETGGQPFFMSALELTNSAHIMRETSRSNSELVLWASNSDSGDGRELTIPVDSTTRRVTFAASFDTKGGDLTLIGPKGVVSGSDGRTEDTISTCSRIVTVEAPQPGAWHAKLIATGRFWLVVHAQSDIALLRAEFVRLGGRPGHEGLFRIAGQPITGEAATLRVRVTDSETIRNVSFALRSREGNELRRVDLTASGDGEFVGQIELPQEPFRVTARGLDASGLPFQRMHSGLFHAESVEVTATGNAEDLTPGTTAVLSFAVRNAGPPASFRIVAVDGRQFLKRFEPQMMTLEKGAVGVLKVWMTVPADIPTGTGVDITVTATSTSSPKTTNGTSRHLTIGESRFP